MCLGMFWNFEIEKSQMWNLIARNKTGDTVTILCHYQNVGGVTLCKLKNLSLMLLASAAVFQCNFITLLSFKSDADHQYIEILHQFDKIQN